MIVALLLTYLIHPAQNLRPIQALLKKTPLPNFLLFIGQMMIQSDSPGTNFS
jgi:hypothetical protein